MTAYYNEIEPYAAEWLRNLIKEGHIAHGIVDTRSILDVTPGDLRGFTQCHFFAGIGAWSYALRLAGWPDDRPVWTGSCPCQPFSAAGKGGGFDDERHLWPYWHYLIEQREPVVVFGEQVASKDGLAWLDLVHADMEATGYAIGAVDLCAAGVGAPHIRQRQWIVAERLADADEQQRDRAGITGAGGWPQLADRSADGGMAHGDDAGLEGRRQPGCQGPTELSAGPGGMVGGMADADSWQCNRLPDGEGCQRNGAQAGWVEGDRELERCGAVGRLADTLLTGRPEGRTGAGHRSLARGSPSSGLVHVEQGTRPGPTNGFWRDADWLFCRDGKWRPVEPGTFPLAHGVANRVGKLRACGNAISPWAAKEVIAAYMERRQ